MKEQQHISNESSSKEQYSKDESKKRASRHARKKVWKKIRYGCYLLFLLIPVFYLAIQIRSIYFRPYITHPAIEVTLSDAVSAKGMVFRQEVPIYAPQDSVVGYMVEDGTRVPINTNVVAQYADEKTAHNNLKSKELSFRIESLEYAQSEKGTTADLESLSKRQQSNYYQYLEMLEKQDYSMQQNTILDLTESVNRLQISAGRETDYQDLIETLKAEKETLLAAGSPVAYCASPSSGFFFSETDGYEEIFSFEDALNWNEQQLNAAFESEIQNSSEKRVGKIVSDYKWYFICFMDEKDAERFLPLAESYQKVFLNFSGNNDASIPAYVHMAGEIENGKRKMVFRSETISPEIAALRFETASIYTNTVTGLRVDKEALHVDNGQYGVYIRRGNIANYRKITPIFENEQYLLVPLTENPEKTGINELKMFDEIIVEGIDLYDGKLL